MRKWAKAISLKELLRTLLNMVCSSTLGGIDGLLHITDMSWGRVNHPSEMFSIGDKVTVMVLKYDKEKERVSLGLKQTSPDPWVDVDSKFPVETKIKR